jgi:UDPglucose 6-dehydrogenase
MNPAAGRGRIGVFGAGYVGIVTAAGLAEIGRSTVLFDTDAEKIALLSAGGLPIHEAGLPELVARGTAASRLQFTNDPAEAVAGCGAVFIAVGTPNTPAGRADLTNVREAAGTIAKHLDGPTIIVNKSTVPVDTGDLVAGIVRDARLTRRAVVVSNPEFLREGSAVNDFFHPDRIVIGCDDGDAEAFLRELYAPLAAPVIVTDMRTAEMIKYAANAFLATKISFANEMAAICAGVGADVTAVLAGAGADARIGTAYFGAGLGFGGSCLPKDVRALRQIAAAAAVEPALLDATLDVNRRQVERVCARIGALLDGLPGRRVGVLGLAFKAGTDDVRDSPAIALVEALLAAGAEVAVHDPVAMEHARTVLGSRVAYAPPGDGFSVATGADALVLATDWEGYRDPDLAALRALMRAPLLVDARNFYDPQRIARAGFRYEGIGRTA